MVHSAHAHAWQHGTEAPTVNQSFTELSKYKQSGACTPNNKAVKWCWAPAN